MNRIFYDNICKQKFLCVCVGVRSGLHGCGGLGISSCQWGRFWRVLLLLTLAFYGAFKGDRCVFSITVYTFKGRCLAVPVVMALSGTLRADLFSFFALISAVAEFVAFKALCDWSVFFNINVIGRYYL